MASELARIPPQNLEAEMSLLGALLLDKDAMIKIGDKIRAEDFYKQSHRDIYETIAELFSNREPIDILSLANRLEEKKKLEQIGGRTYLVTLSNTVPTAAHAEHYAAIISKKATLRRLVDAASKITAMSFSQEDDVSATLDQAEQHLFAVSQSHLAKGFTPIKDVLADAFTRIDELHKGGGKLRGQPTGFKELDSLLAGLQKSDLVILAARPSVGKTSLALDIVRGVAINGKVPVGLFSLEMSKEQLVDRLICAEARVDLWKMRNGKLSERQEDDDFSRIGHALGVLSEAQIFIDDSPSANIMEIRTKARRLKMEHGLGLLVIDYLQLMESRSAESRVQEISEITRGLKGIARELDIPVLALSQLSRVTEMSKPAIPKLAHLRESGCLTGDALIQLADGRRVPIRELAKNTQSMPFEVLAMNEQWRIVPAMATRAFASGRKPVFELRMRSGRAVQASANHRFQKLDTWSRLDEMHIGDRIALPRQLDTRGTSGMTESELTLLAHLLGDGCVLPHQPYHYTSADQECINAVSAAATNAFGISPRIVKQENWWHVYLPSPYRLARGKQHPITQWFEAMGIERVRAPLKRIPDAVFAEPTDRIAFFLRHLWSTDGNISATHLAGRKTGAAIYYSSTSPILAEQVQHLLLCLGIWSTLRKVPQGKYRPSYHVHVQGNEHQLLFLKLVGAIGKRGKTATLIKHLEAIEPNTNLDTIPEDVWRTQVVPQMATVGMTSRGLAVGLSMSYAGTSLYKSSVGRERLSRVARVLKSKALKTLAASDVYWDEIVSISPMGEADTFDLTVPGVHNFIANDIVVHNSIEQDADVVMFIYRKAADRNYQKDDIPPEERSLAEVHIAKHRNGPTGMVRLFFDEQRACFRNLDKDYSHVPAAEAGGVSQVRGRGDMGGNAAPF